MLFPFRGRKCWILVDDWERHAVIRGRVTKTKQGRVTSARGCPGWMGCGGRMCRGVEVDFDGKATVEFICTPDRIYASRRAAKREAERQNRIRRAGML